MVVVGRAHPIDLLLHRRNDLVIACQREEPVVCREQQRDTVVSEQRSGIALASPARRKGVEVLAKPPTYVAVVHNHEPYRRRAIAARIPAISRREGQALQFAGIRAEKQMKSSWRLAKLTHEDC